MKHAPRMSWASLAFGVGLLASGCAPAGSADPNSPDDVDGPGNSPTGTRAPGRPSAQVSSAQVAVARASRPQMSAAAAQAYDAGTRAFRAGDLASAGAQFRRATEADPRAYQAHYSLGVVNERAGQLAQAQAAYRAALGVVPEYEPAILGFASLLLRTGRIDEAERYLSQERSRLPNSAAVLAGLAEAKSLRKDSASAQAFAQEALKKDPGYRPAMVILARDHYRNRRLDLALLALAAILDGYGAENPARDPGNGEARLLRALIYTEQNKRTEAITEFTRAVELRPDLVDARIHLATLSLEAGNAARAATLLEEALRYDPANTLVHLNLGDAYRLQGRPVEALKQLEWVALRDPNLAEAHYNLGLVYLFSSNVPGFTPAQAIDKAITEFERFKSMRPRARPGAGDDVDDLLKRAQNKKAVAAAMATGGGNGGS